MSRWGDRAARAVAARHGAPIVPKAPKHHAAAVRSEFLHGSLVPVPPEDEASGSFGTIGTIGAAPEGDLDERIAMAEVEGGVPALYATVFAKLQLTPPAGLSVERWLEAVDDAGRFLDRFGPQAVSLGWTADDLFGCEGLVLALKGALDVGLSRSRARLSDGREHLKSRS